MCVTFAATKNKVIANPIAASENNLDRVFKNPIKVIIGIRNNVTSRRVIAPG